MNKFLPLEKWSPKELVEIYSNSFRTDQELLDQNFTQINEALYRLGTNIDMKACWEKLLSKKTFLPKQELVEPWLVSQIYLMLSEIFIRPDEKITPQFKKKEITKIVNLVKKLIDVTNKSDEALTASLFTFSTKISEEIIKKYPEKSMNIGFDIAPISSWPFISGVSDVINLSTEDQSLELLEWDLWSDDKKSAWILTKLKNMHLTSLLQVYLQQLKEIPKTYKSEYIIKNRAAVTEQLYELTHKTYGDYMSDCVTPMVNAILGSELGTEDVTSYKQKKKTVKT